MSKIIKVEFGVSTCYIGSEVKKVVEIEIDEDMTQEEIDGIIEEEFNEWIWENINSWTKIIEE